MASETNVCVADLRGTLQHAGFAGEGKSPVWPLVFPMSGLSLSLSGLLYSHGESSGLAFCIPRPFLCLQRRLAQPPPQSCVFSACWVLSLPQAEFFHRLGSQSKAVVAPRPPRHSSEPVSNLPNLCADRWSWRCSSTWCSSTSSSRCCYTLWPAPGLFLPSSSLSETQKGNLRTRR